MVRCLVVFLFVSVSIARAETVVEFGKFFKNKTLRIDVTLGGDKDATVAYLEQMKKQGEWAGSKTHLVDRMQWGNFRYLLKDKESGELIFSRGFTSLFQEWQTTPEAKVLKRSFYHVLLMPFPKKEAVLVLETRTWDGNSKELMTLDISPADYFIEDEQSPKYDVVPIMENGPHDKKVDLVFLPEGYTADEMDKFQQDIKRMTDYMFAMRPFNQHKSDFNLYAVLVPSLESGTDVPGERIYRNTAFNSNFYTFDSPRYLTTRDLKAVHDAAATATYDQVYVLVNSGTYGGGGFYNYLNLTSVDHTKSPQVFVHEFAHGFAGLADEYYDSEVSFEEFYNLKVEPWEPNITTLVDFDRKWKGMMADDVPQPTPRKEKYQNSLGLFEGGGYMAKGIYSPMMNCRMKTNEAEGFCPVCAKAIEEAIQLYSE